MSPCKECKSGVDVQYGRCKACRTKWAREMQVRRKIRRISNEVRNYCPDCEGYCHGHQPLELEEAI